MPCEVHFTSGAKLTLSDDAESVTHRLGHVKLERFEQPGTLPDVWINAANVLYVLESRETPQAVGFS